MRLLILTQKVDMNDNVLGFFHDWILEFAKHFNSVTVVCLQKGEYDLPKNVRVLSLGKENGYSKIKYLLNFYKYIFKERKNYDKVFIHMNPIYILLGGLFWKVWKKKIGLWYVHKRVDFKLRIANLITDKIFTASQNSYNLKNPNLKILGHGIRISDFNFKNSDLKKEIFKIIYVGRISRIKNQKLFIEALDILVNEKGLKNIKANVIGPVVYGEDEEYKNELENLINEKKLNAIIELSGPVPFKKMPEIYMNAGLSVNLCPTGGVDKSVLESMSAGLPVLVLNKSFNNILDEKYMLDMPDKHELAKKIDLIINSENTMEEGKKLREIVEKKFSLTSLINNISAEL